MGYKLAAARRALEFGKSQTDRVEEINSLERVGRLDAPVRFGAARQKDFPAGSPPSIPTHGLTYCIVSC